MQDCLPHLPQIKKSFLALALEVYPRVYRVVMGVALALALLNGSVALAECESTANPNYEQYSAGKNSYECNVQNICLGKGYGGDYWNFNTDKQLIISHDKTKYPNIQKTGSQGIEDIRKIYLDTQNNIMNCALLKSKYSLHKKIIDDYDISEKAIGYLEKANKEIEKQIEDMKCVPPRDGDKIYAYKDLLDSLTYEQCGYSMYLWYYQNVCKQNSIVCIGKNKPYTALETVQVLETQNNILKDEYDLSQRSVYTALSMYDNFEKTYVAHVLLEMIEVELTEDKRFMGVTMKAIQQWLSLARNAQKSEGDR